MYQNVTSVYQAASQRGFTSNHPGETRAQTIVKVVSSRFLSPQASTSGNSVFSIVVTVIKSKEFKDVTNKQHFGVIYCNVDVVKYNFSAQPSFYWTLPMTGTLSTFILFFRFQVS